MSWIAFALIAAVLMSMASLLEKRTLLFEHAMEFAAVMSVMNALVGLPLLFAADIGSLNVRAVVVILFSGLLSALSFFFAAKSVRHMEISVSSPLFALGSGLTALFAFIFLGEGLGSWQIGGLMLLLVGSYTLSLGTGSSLVGPLREFFTSRYMHFMALAILCYSIGALVDRAALSRFGIDPKAYLGLVQICVALYSVMMLHIFHDGFAGVRHGFKKMGWILLVISCLTVAHRFAYLEAVAATQVGLAVAVKRSSVLFTTIIGGELFHEHNLVRKTVAAAIIVAGVVFMAL